MASEDITRQFANHLAERATLAIGPADQFAIEGRAATAAVLRELAGAVPVDGRANVGGWLDDMANILEGLPSVPGSSGEVQGG